MEFVEIRNMERFNAFMRDLAAGHMRRCTFEPWEIALLLDFSGCRPKPRRRRMILESYKLAVLNGARQGLSRFPVLSVFLSAECASRNKKEPVDMALAVFTPHVIAGAVMQVLHN